MVKKLSDTGRTRFTVENIDWGFIDTALKNYKQLIIDTPDNTDPTKISLVSKDWLIERVDSLIETFKVESVDGK